MSRRRFSRRDPCGRRPRCRLSIAPVSLQIPPCAYSLHGPRSQGQPPRICRLARSQIRPIANTDGPTVATRRHYGTKRSPRSWANQLLLWFPRTVRHWCVLTGFCTRRNVRGGSLASICSASNCPARPPLISENLTSHSIRHRMGNSA